MPQIIIDIDKNGTPTISVEGINGPSCKDITAPYEKAFGGEIAEEVKTADYHRRSGIEEEAKVKANA